MANKNQKKNYIFLKSSVIAMGIIFLVLVVLLIILQINKSKKQKIIISDCNQKHEIVINNEVDKIIDSKRELIILTKPRNKKQQLLTLDKKCGLIKGNIELLIK